MEGMTDHLPQLHIIPQTHLILRQIRTQNPTLRRIPSYRHPKDVIRIILRTLLDSRGGRVAGDGVVEVGGIAGEGLGDAVGGGLPGGGGVGEVHELESWPSAQSVACKRLPEKRSGGHSQYNGTSHSPKCPVRSSPPSPPSASHIAYATAR